MKHLSKFALRVYIFVSLGSLVAKDELRVITSVSVGELLDRITVLEVKEKDLKSNKKRANVSRELTILKHIFADTGIASPELDNLVATLRDINEDIWDLINAIRIKEAHREYDTEFKQLAACIIEQNDARARIKYAINLLTNSAIIEEKSYKDIEGRHLSSSEKSILVAIEIPFADLIDKITILEVKLATITDTTKRAHIATELELLCQTRDSICTITNELEKLTAELRAANRTMFDIQDALRAKMKTGTLDDEFVRLSHNVDFTNDKRCKTKHAMNTYIGSHLIEEKEYTSCDTLQAFTA